MAKHVRKQNARAKFKPLKWNLPFVLHRLKEHPFEPLDSVGMSLGICWHEVPNLEDGLLARLS